MTSIHLGRAMRRLMVCAIDRNGSVHAQSLGAEATFTMAMDEAYDYNLLGDLDPSDLHSEFRSHASNVSKAAWNSSEDYLDEHLVDLLSRMVFGSNLIEGAGGGCLDITLKLCRLIFRGEVIPVVEFGEACRVLEDGLGPKGLPHAEEDIIQSYREIVQHAEAAYYILREVCFKGKDLTESIILETHRLLTYKIDADEIPWNEYAGVYRKWPVCTGFHQYMAHTAVPAAMKNMIDSFEEDIKAAIEAGEIDPIALAAKYCHKFVNIHPFLDGNGRTCRLILNALLFKYGGVIVCIGEEDEDRDEYLRIASNASFAEGNQEDMEGVPEGLWPKHYKELASFVLLHARDGMATMRELLNEE